MGDKKIIIPTPVDPIGKTIFQYLTGGNDPVTITVPDSNDVADVKEKFTALFDLTTTIANMGGEMKELKDIMVDTNAVLKELNKQLKGGE